MAARFLAATKAASRRLNAYPYSTSAPRSRSLMALGSPVPSISSLPGQYHRPILRRSFSSEERLQQQMDVLKNEVGELKLSIQSNSEKQKLFEATVRSEITNRNWRT